MDSNFTLNVPQGKKRFPIFLIFFLFILGSFIIVVVVGYLKTEKVAQLSSHERVNLSTSTLDEDLNTTSIEKTRIQRVKIGKQIFLLEIADNEASRSIGLGGRKHIGEYDGMIFIFDRPERHGFWMKDTFLTLDMVWIGRDFKIVSLENDVLPESYPKVFYPSEKSLYTIEFSAGVLEKMNIKIGDRVFFVE